MWQPIPTSLLVAYHTLGTLQGISVLARALQYQLIVLSPVHATEAAIALPMLCQHKCWAVVKSFNAITFRVVQILDFSKSSFE